MDDSKPWEGKKYIYQPDSFTCRTTTRLRRPGRRGSSWAPGHYSCHVELVSDTHVSNVSRVPPVDGGELEPVVSREGVAGVARVAAHPQPVVLGLPVQPGHNDDNQKQI